MKIRTITGTLVDLDKKEAEKLIAMGFATAVEEPKKAPTKKTTTKKAKKESK